MSISEKYRYITYNGSTFPDDPYREVMVTLNHEIKDEYFPAMQEAFPNIQRGMAFLITAMTKQEGFFKGSKSYRTNNPGNIGNVDTGASKSHQTLTDGIKKQVDFIQRIILGGHKAFPIGKPVKIIPYLSPDVGWCPGYNFTYIGQLDQFIKIYSTGARKSNSYINTIVSYFKINGVIITPESTLQQIVSV